MRLITLTLLSLSSSAALAHTPDGGLLVSLTHMFTSPHHLPLALLALVAGLFLVRRYVIGRVKTRRDR